MRYIRKRGEPRAFKDWKRLAANEPDGFTYPIRDRTARNAVLKQMRTEQGALCAYTMWRLNKGVRESIEHIYCREHHKDRALDYGNMVLCAKGTLKIEFAFGESRKGNFIVTNENFVSPLKRDCESRFVFHDDGRIEEAKAADEAAKQTIKLLNLNDRTLQAARQGAIQGAGLGRERHRPASIAKARRLIESISNLRAGDPLPAFAIAIKQSALRFVQNHEKLGRRLAARQDR